MWDAHNFAENSPYEKNHIDFAHKAMWYAHRFLAQCMPLHFVFYIQYLSDFLGRRFDRFVPLVYVLASHKDVLTYSTIMEQLKIKEPSLNPKHAMVDFESAAIRGISIEFPGTEINGCFFHFTQCIWRNIQNLGLAAKYASDVEFAWQLRHLAALAFIPMENVKDSFKKLKTILHIKKRAAEGTDDHKVIKLFEYFENTWIGKGPAQGKFPIRMWNMCAITLPKMPRTNNAVEGWHNAINQFVGCKNPSIWTFIEKIKKEQDVQEVKMVEMMNNNGATKKKKYVDHDLNIYTIVKTYTDDKSKYKLKEYLGTIANHLSY